MSAWKLPLLISRVLGGARGRWHWVLRDAESDSIWTLVREDPSGVEHVTDVYALGDSLSMPARIFASVTPDALHEMSERALLVQESLERVERLTYLVKRLRTRAYRLQRSDEYEDLRAVAAELLLVQQLLGASQMPPLAELEHLELQALESLKNPPAGL